MTQGNIVKINLKCRSSLSFFPPKPAIGRAAVLPVHDSETMAGVLQHLLYFCQSLFFQCVQIYTSKKPISASPKPCSKSIHRTHQLGWWKGSVNQMAPSLGWVAAGWQPHGRRRWLLRPVGKVPHSSSCWVSCCGSLSLRIVTALKDTFAAVAAQPGFECSQCLSTGVEKQPCCAKMQQEGPASGCWCRSRVHR